MNPQQHHRLKNYAKGKTYNVCPKTKWFICFQPCLSWASNVWHDCSNASEATIELQIEPSSVYKQEWDTMVTAMFTTFWPLKVGTLHERKISLKNTKVQGPFF